MEELKKCPFCGGEAEMNVNVGIYGYTPDIYCAICKCCGAKIEMVSDNYNDLSTAVIDAWNRRVSDADCD
jgi:Lar family restriction alleviation protein